MKFIGITGGIGAGKSTVTGYLQQRGYTVIDTDKIAHEVTMPGRPLLQKIAEVLGQDVIREDGSMDRMLVSSRIFGHTEMRTAYEAVIHAAIIGTAWQRAHAAAAAEPNKPVFLDVPLLFEVGMDKDCQEVWVVDAPVEIRVARVMQRGLTEEQVRARMGDQMSSEERNRRAAHVLDGSGDLPNLHRQIDALLQRGETV